MKGNPQVIDFLNRVLSSEMQAINQYFIHARMCENWGYERLWKRIREESIDEMRHADFLIERILYLEGVPNLQKLPKISVGKTVHEQFKLDLALEHTAIPMLNEGIEVCRTAGDGGSRELLERILLAEEKHTNWLEAQLHLMQELGEAAYLAEQVKES